MKRRPGRQGRHFHLIHLAAFQSLLMIAISDARGQVVYDLGEINGDVRMLGDAIYDAVGDRDTVTVLDFNMNGINDVFVIKDQVGSVYGYFDVNSSPNTFTDLRVQPPDFLSPGTGWPLQFYRNRGVDINGDDYKDLAFSDTSSQDFRTALFVLYSSTKWTSGTMYDLETNPADVNIFYYDQLLDNSFFGEALGSGDINGDGIMDIIIGAHDAPNPEMWYKGAVFIIFGSSQFPEHYTISLPSEHADITLYGEGGNADFGYSVASGDINGDGINDIIVGAPRGDLDYYGCVYAFYGSTSFPPEHVVDLTYEEADVKIKSTSLYSFYGRCVAVGDINGDGIDDICGGGDNILNPDGEETGGAFVIYGSRNFPPHAFIDLATQEANISCYGEFDGANFGGTMAASDMDGDGVDDFLVSSLDSNLIPEEAGIIYILQGSTQYPEHLTVDFATDAPSAYILGDDEGDWLQVAGEMADLNGDGLKDYVVGSFDADREDAYRCGEAYIILGGRPLNDPPLIVAGPGPSAGNPAEVRLHNPYFSEQGYTRFVPYLLPGYGTVVGTGDLDGDAYDEVLTGPGPGPYHPPTVRAFDPDGSQVFAFQAYGARRFGVNVSTGNLDGGDALEIITGAGPGEVYGPHVRGWRWNGGASVTPLAGVSFLAYNTHRWGVNVAAGDIDGDGFDEIVTGAGPGDVFGPHVRGWNWDGNGTTAPIPGVSFQAYGIHHWGVNVACGDIDGDLIDEILTGPGPGQVFSSHVRGWNYDGVALSAISGVNFIAYPTLPAGYGAVVACGDVDNDRVDEILTAPGPGPDLPPYLKTWNYDGQTLTLVQGKSFMVFEPEVYRAGAKIAFGHFRQDPPFLP